MNILNKIGLIKNIIGAFKTKKLHIIIIFLCLIGILFSGYNIIKKDNSLKNMMEDQEYTIDSLISNA